LNYLLIFNILLFTVLIFIGGIVRHFSLTVLSVFLVIIFGTCNLFSPPTGSVKINLDSDFSSLTTETASNLEIGSYELTLNGPEGSVSKSVSGDKNMVTLEALAEGEWEISAKALKEGDSSMVLGQDTATVTIVAEKEATAGITIKPDSADGTLSVEAEWPDKTYNKVNIEAFLVSENGNTRDISNLFSVDISSDPNTASYSGNWENGDYTLSLSILEGSDLQEASTVWKKNETINIAAFQDNVVQFYPKKPEDGKNAYLDIANGRIFDGTFGMEYSTDNASTWSPGDGAVTEVDFSEGDSIWVREKTDLDAIKNLGTVKTLSGRPDLMPLECYIGRHRDVGDKTYYYDNADGAPGEVRSLRVRVKNIGDTTFSSKDITLNFYLSEDSTITKGDMPLYSKTYNLNEFSPDKVSLFFHRDCIEIPDVPPGHYYVGCIISTESDSAELTAGNNTTSPMNIDEIQIADSSNVSEGAIKVVNSWGDFEWSEWENIHDGHYWLTYDTVKSLKMKVYYYENDFSSVYSPTAVALFDISGDVKRDTCLIRLGMGDPADPIMEKRFQTNGSGNLAFPNNSMALDISEFAQYLNDYNLYLKADNTADTANSGNLNSFSLELYSDYNAGPIKTISMENLGNIASGQENIFTLQTKEKLTDAEEQDIFPSLRSPAGGVTLHEEKPDKAELSRDMELIGVYQPGKNYNIISKEGFGRGYAPPTREQWNTLTKLREVDTNRLRGALPEQVDHSATKYFPPIGSQAGEGSCSAFAHAYYIHTFTEAKEHNWDLSTISWTGGWDGQPDGSLNKIMSPDFIYHQINGGVDNGASISSAANTLIRVGGASWSEMPYDYEDSTSWPNKEAYLEAAQYRADEVGQNYWDRTSSYFIIEDDSDIHLLKELIAAGYCVSTGVYSGDQDGYGIYDLFDSNDVVSGYSGGPMNTNHANTIVGYKEGTEWDENNPDN